MSSTGVSNRRSRWLHPLLIMLFLGLPGVAGAGITAAAPVLPGARPALSSRPSPPLLFIQNVGQFAQGARFQVWGGPGTFWLGGDGSLWLSVAGSKFQVSSSKLRRGPRLRQRGTWNMEPGTGVNLRFTFVGANAHPALVPFGRLDTHVSYFLGQEATRWHPDVPVWSGARYANLYPGIDLELTGAGGVLRPRLIVHPGARLADVRLRVAGADAVAVAGGDIVLATVAGRITLLLFQPVTPTGLPVSPRTHPTITNHDIATPFAVTPPLSDFRLHTSDFSATYLGGSADDGITGMVVDAAGDSYVTGYTASSDFPTTPGAFGQTCGCQGNVFDAFAAKLNGTGTALLQATFLGGSNSDQGTSIALAGHGEVVVAGYTISNDYPVTKNAYQRVLHGGCDVENVCHGDAVVTRLNATGTKLVYSTYLGGHGDDYAAAVALDSAGNVYLTGATSSNNFPTTKGAVGRKCRDCPAGSNGWAAKLNATGSKLLYGAYLSGKGDTSGAAIAVDAAGNATVAGGTNAADFPTTPGAFQRAFHGGCAKPVNACGDAFVVRLNPTATQFLYATYLGGSGGDVATALAVDGAGDAYVTGATASTDFPVTPGVVQGVSKGGCTSGVFGACGDAFVTEFNPAGSGLIYSTYLGGTGGDEALALGLDGAGNVVIAGATESTDFPLTSNAFQRVNHGGCDYYNDCGDGFVARLNPGATALAYGSYLGGTGYDLIAALALDAAGRAHLGAC